MSTASPSLRTALDALPKGVPFALVIAGHDDAANGRTPQLAPLTPAKLAELKDVLEDISFEGGTDNVPALLGAWDLAALSDAAIVWVHGPQPVSLTSPAALEQRWDRRADGPRLYAVSAATGPNRILEAFDGVDAVVTVPRRGALQDDLARLFKSFQRGASRVQAQRNRLDASAAAEATNGAHRTSEHLVRLWAHDEVRELLRDRKHPEQRQLATALAARHALVTPVTGAVVLETQAQFQQAGLEPVAAGEVPTIPEPETWALLAMVLLFAVGVSIAARLRARAATGLL
jgi:hypothetical protein